MGLRPGERIPLHDHSDLNSGGRVHAPAIVRGGYAGGSSGSGSGSGITAHTQLTNVSADQHHAENHASRHAAGGPDEIAGAGRAAVLLASDHSTPFTFDEILQASDASDFLYASE